MKKTEWENAFNLYSPAIFPRFYAKIKRRMKEDYYQKAVLDFMFEDEAEEIKGGGK